MLLLLRLVLLFSASDVDGFRMVSARFEDVGKVASD